MWITNNQGKNYWIPDNFPESTEEYNSTQLSKQYKTPYGTRSHPLWSYENGAYVDDEYLLNNEGWKLLIDNPPTYDTFNEVLEKNNQSLWNETDTQIEVTYTVRNKTEQEIIDQKSAKWVEVRVERNKKLAKLDHIIGIAFENGFTLSDKFKQYRQSLRDLPENFDDPFNITWPEEISDWEYYE